MLNYVQLSTSACIYYDKTWDARRSFPRNLKMNHRIHCYIIYNIPLDNLFKEKSTIFEKKERIYYTILYAYQ